MQSDKTIEALAESFKALSDPNRLRILALLQSTPNPICVNAIARNIGLSQSAVSQHLRVLRNSGFVSVKKEGYYKHYSIDPDNFDDLRSVREAVLGEDLKI